MGGRLMLYQIGSIAMDTRPFNANGVERSTSAEFATKALMQTMQAREFMGEGDETIAISGQLLPYKTGGLTSLEAAQSLRKAGTRLPVMRGDGRMLGWYAITDIRESHSELSREGIGFVVSYTLSLVKVSPDTGSSGIIGVLLSLFGALGR